VIDHAPPEFGPDVPDGPVALAICTPPVANVLRDGNWM